LATAALRIDLSEVIKSIALSKASSGRPGFNLAKAGFNLETSTTSEDVSLCKEEFLPKISSKQLRCE
jgi:hypothetical protein